MRLPHLAAGQLERRTVVLTFDDGPHLHHTPQILEELNRRSIRAIFFVIGECAKKHLDIVQYAFSTGHIIGNHGFTHTDLTKLDGPGVREEILRTEDVIGQFLRKDKVFRPPYGARNATVDSVVASLGYRTILWDASARDWSSKYQPDRWVRRGTAMVRLGGSVVLLHDNLPGTSQHVGRFIDALQGLRRVHLLTLAGAPSAPEDSRRMPNIVR